MLFSVKEGRLTLPRVRWVLPAGTTTGGWTENRGEWSFASRRRTVRVMGGLAADPREETSRATTFVEVDTISLQRDSFLVSSGRTLLVS